MAARQDWNVLLGTNNPKASKGGKKGDPKAEDASALQEPAGPPTTVLMHTITGNPENPRQPEDYTDDDSEFVELKDTMVEVGQLQPLAVVSHDRYVLSKPEFAKAVKGHDWVVVTGNRRLAAARQLGWTRIDIRVQDRLGDDDKIDDAVIIENIHRKNIDPVREAEFLARMVEKHGSQEEVGRRIGKTQMYVSHRLALLKLAPEVQEELEAGRLKPSQVRGLAAKPVEEQLAKVDEIKQAKLKPKKDVPPVQNAVLKPTLEPATEADADHAEGTLQNGVLKTANPEHTAKPDSVPEPRAHDQQVSTAAAVHAGQGAGEASRSGRPLRYDEPGYINGLLRTNMAPLDFALLSGYMLEAVACDQPHLLGQVLKGAFAKLEGDSLKEAMAVVLDAVKDPER
ncbi:ParB/RepB/Spo0J family partition protein [Streptomyces sp. NPDC055955]|uniref:ParB/RepB/Spo0J family partition protein n=1 Tax=Streptomyces sp. NPDC055955 TaxID=3345665 RepID=UPI0035E03054